MDSSGITGENIGELSQVLERLANGNSSSALLTLLPTEHSGGPMYSVKTPDDLFVLGEIMSTTDSTALRELAHQAFARSFSMIDDNAELIENSVEALCRAFQALQHTFVQTAGAQRGYVSFVS